MEKKLVDLNFFFFFKTAKKGVSGYIKQLIKKKCPKDRFEILREK